MPSGYHHLTHEERCRTCALRKSGLSDPAIARQLGRDRTTVWREIRRTGCALAAEMAGVAIRSGSGDTIMVLPGAEGA